MQAPGATWCSGTGAGRTGSNCAPASISYGSKREAFARCGGWSLRTRAISRSVLARGPRGASQRLRGPRHFDASAHFFFHSSIDFFAALACALLQYFSVTARAEVVAWMGSYSAARWLHT